MAASKVLSREAADAELEYVLTKSELVLDPANESPWRYLIAVVKEQIFALEDGAQVMSLLSRVQERILALEFAPEDGNDQKATCPNLQSALIDLLEWKGDPESLREASERAQSLADEHDTIRQKYWQFRVQEMQSALLLVNKLIELCILYRRKKKKEGSSCSCCVLHRIVIFNLLSIPTTLHNLHTHHPLLLYVVGKSSIFPIH